MGEKRVSIRTLPSGERVTDYPPSADYPSGHQELIRDRSALRERLDEHREAKQARHDAIHARHVEAIEAKKARQAAAGLPPEKSAL